MGALYIRGVLRLGQWPAGTFRPLLNHLYLRADRERADWRLSNVQEAVCQQLGNCNADDGRRCDR